MVLSGRFDDHLAVVAVEEGGEAAAVVEEVEGVGGMGSCG